MLPVLGYHLWIDRVGCYRVLCSPVLTIGGPQEKDQDPASHLAIMGDLSRKHATLQRTSTGYVLTPHHTVSVNQVVIKQPTCLQHQDKILLGKYVELQWHQPSALSLTGRLEFLSSHRPKLRIDGLVLMENLCLLGPGAGQHIPCRHWLKSIIIFGEGTATQSQPQQPGSNPTGSISVQSGSSKKWMLQYAQSPLQRHELLPGKFYEEDDIRLQLEALT
jgi:hypothetical protein